MRVVPGSLQLRVPVGTWHPSRVRGLGRVPSGTNENFVWGGRCVRSSDILIKFQFKCVPTADFSCDHLTVWLLHDFDEFAGVTEATPHQTVRFVPPNTGNIITQGGSLLQVGADGQAEGNLGISLVQAFDGFGATKSLGMDEQGARSPVRCVPQP